ncbi:MAG: hypothetical protein U1A78_26005 [Polyangia bacterium]
MRDILDFYVRSLAEREDLGEAPEFRQDLGTFFDWLLERLGYTIHMRSYKHLGTKRVKSAGQSQWGVDILASKYDRFGESHVYLFVMKQGDIGAREWAPSDEGSMSMDLWDAATRSAAIDKWYAPADPAWKSRTVVAVHNGDLRKDKIGAQVETTIRDIESKHGVKVEWWDADRLVALTLAAEGEIPDATLFPPAVRPHIRMALDSLKKPICGSQFDYASIDLYLNRALPGTDTLKKESNTPATLRLRRHLSELALVSSLIEEHARRDAEDTTLPTLDSIERMSSRALSWVDRLPGDERDEFIAQVRKSSGSQPKSHESKILEALLHLANQYIRRASALRDRLEPVVNVRNSLSLSGFSERLDYPIRVLRISGYLASAGLISIDLSAKDKALQFAETIRLIWNSNPGGALLPVTDDQIIEIALVFELWLRLDLKQHIKEFSVLILDRFTARIEHGLPMPAIWQRAAVPFDADQRRVLAETLFLGRNSAHPSFEDSSSTIIVLLIYLAYKTGAQVEDSLLSRFSGTGAGTRVISLQSWKPDETASRKWYIEDVSHEGITQVYTASTVVSRLMGGKKFDSTAERLVSEIETFHTSQPPTSLAAAIGLPSLDRLAWKRWRIPMGMHAIVPMLMPPSSGSNASESTPAIPPAAKVAERRRKSSKPPAAPSTSLTPKAAPASMSAASLPTPPAKDLPTNPMAPASKGADAGVPVTKPSSPASEVLAEPTEASDKKA